MGVAVRCHLRVVYGLCDVASDDCRLFYLTGSQLAGDAVDASFLLQSSYKMYSAPGIEVLHLDQLNRFKAYGISGALYSAVILVYFADFLNKGRQSRHRSKAYHIISNLQVSQVKACRSLLDGSRKESAAFRVGVVELSSLIYDFDYSFPYFIIVVFADAA